MTKVGSVRDGRQLVVEVRDHGNGLPATAIPHIFDRFYKADTARSRSEGSGLGLAIAWENARLHGGNVRAGNAAALLFRSPADLRTQADARQGRAGGFAGKRFTTSKENTPGTLFLYRR